MKIALSAIVGNEEDVIERFIESFSKLVDSIHLVRAVGNKEPDETITLAGLHCSKTGIDFSWSCYHNKKDFNHVDDFGAARQKSWEESQGGDFTIWADADDTITKETAREIRKAAEEGLHDVYLIPYHVRGDKQIVIRERMVKRGVKMKWQHAIHEKMSFGQDVSYKIIKDAAFIHAPLNEKTNSHERNTNILENEISDIGRNLFYLCQEYYQNGKPNLFKKYANAALSLPILDDLERYEILIQLAQTEGTESRKLAAEAFAVMPDRREALALLAVYCIIDKDYKKALEMSCRVLNTDRPRASYWSQNNEWYGWKANELWRQCLRLNDREEDAIEDLYELIDKEKPIVTVHFKAVENHLQSIAIRELWLSYAETPENVDFVFLIDDNDLVNQDALKGFKQEIINSDLKVVIDTVKPYEITATLEEIPEMGWDKKIMSGGIK